MYKYKPKTRNFVCSSNSDIIRIFIDYVESNKLKLVQPYENIVSTLTPKQIEEDGLIIEQTCLQYQSLIDEVSNLRLKKTQTTFTVEQIMKKIDKDRYSATAYGLYYIEMFLNNNEDDDYDESDPLVYWM